MRKTRTIVAVTLLATALCADRPAVAMVPGEARVPDSVAGPSQRLSFAQRLTVSIRRSVAGWRMGPTRLDGVAPVQWAGRLAGAQHRGHTVEVTPFRFRLPPPAV